MSPAVVRFVVTLSSAAHWPQAGGALNLQLQNRDYCLNRDYNRRPTGTTIDRVGHHPGGPGRVGRGGPGRAGAGAAGERAGAGAGARAGAGAGRGRAFRPRSGHGAATGSGPDTVLTKPGLYSSLY